MGELDPDVCWRLVAHAGFGRVAFVRDGEPWVLPVNCVADGRSIVFRTAEGSMLHRLGPRALVTFEADGIDRAAESGWSVLVRGHLREITDGDELAALADGGPEPWAPGPRDQWLRIEPFDVTGRIISRSFRADVPRGVPTLPPD
jgi:nitroimidazol reductase NimA-like FMN-containing flavoprotein (pyridoxamine 5'-phosphate oxidase superfamily)